MVRVKNEPKERPPLRNRKNRQPIKQKQAKSINKTVIPQKHKSLIRTFIKAHNLKDLETISELLHPEFQAYISDMPYPLNKEEYLQGIEMAHQAFSDLFFTIEDMIAEKDKVATRILVRAEHSGDYQGIAPTHTQVEFSGIVMRRIKNGKIIEEWQVNDHLSLMRQIEAFTISYP